VAATEVASEGPNRRISIGELLSVGILDYRFFASYFLAPVRAVASLSWVRSDATAKTTNLRKNLFAKPNGALLSFVELDSQVFVIDAPTRHVRYPERRRYVLRAKHDEVSKST